MLEFHTFLVIMKLELYGYDCEYPGTKKGNTVVWPTQSRKCLPRPGQGQCISPRSWGMKRRCPRNIEGQRAQGK